MTLSPAFGSEEDNILVKVSILICPETRKEMHRKKKKKKYEKKENHLGTKIIDKSGESIFPL